MSPRPSPHLDVYLVEPWLTPWAFDARARIVDAGWVAAGRSGPRSDAVVRGGFSGWRLEEHDRVVLYANRQGGFAVRCRACGGNLAPAFTHVWARLDPSARITCACGWAAPLPDLDFFPDAAFGRRAVALIGAASFDVDREEVTRVLGAARIVGSRR